MLIYISAAVVAILDFKYAPRTQNLCWLFRYILINKTTSIFSFYIFRQCTYIVFILPCTKPKQLTNCLKRAETDIVLSVLEAISLCSFSLILRALHYKQHIPVDNLWFEIWICL
jgi:branched-subunit amino acid permease